MKTMISHFIRASRCMNWKKVTLSLSLTLVGVNQSLAGSLSNSQKTKQEQGQNSKFQCVPTVPGLIKIDSIDFPDQQSITVRSGQKVIEGVVRIVSACDRHLSYDIEAQDDLNVEIQKVILDSVADRSLGLEAKSFTRKDKVYKNQLVILTEATHKKLRWAVERFEKAAEGDGKIIFTDDQEKIKVSAPYFDSDSIDFVSNERTIPSRSIETRVFLERIKESLGVAQLAKVREILKTKKEPYYSRYKDRYVEILELGRGAEAYYKAIYSAVKNNKGVAYDVKFQKLEGIPFSNFFHPVSDSIEIEYFALLFVSAAEWQQVKQKVYKLADIILIPSSLGGHFSKTRIDELLDNIWNEEYSRHKGLGYAGGPF